MTKSCRSSIKMESNKEKEACTHPRASANPLSIITFAWILPIFKKGFKKELEVEDLYGVLPEHKSDYLGNHMQSLWNKELQLAKLHRRKPSVARILFRCFGLKVFGLGFVLATSEFIFKLLQPLLLGRLIRYFTADSEISYEMAFVYAVGIVLCSAGATMVKQPYMLATFHIGMKTRVGLCSLVYRKALRLSKTALGETTVGQAVNLLSNDMNRLDHCAYFLVYIWFGPVQTIFVGYILFHLVGISAIIGIAVIGLLVPIQGAFGRLLSSLRMRTAKRTDERIRFMNEIIVGIQVIKMYAWEKSFAHLVDLCRRREIKIIKHASFIRGFLLSFEKFSTRIAIFIAVVTHVLLTGSVTAEQIFVVTAYFNTLKQTMTDLIPRSIAQISEAYTSLKRIQTFLLYEEVSIQRSFMANSMNATNTQEDDESETLIGLKQNNIKTSKTAITEGLSESETLNSNQITEKYFEEIKGIVINSISAKWTEDLNDNTLTDISMTVKSGQLVAIIGPVGSGKTSLLHAILGELPILHGTISVKGTVSYASQEPWLFMGSVKENILFGQPFDRKRYKEVIHICALEFDLKQFPYGDSTIIGERGVTLSGGQRARINLARAVYKKADIYLLDDPLSAVDSHVGRHLFEDCISGFLSDKAVILVTHQLQFLASVDTIVLLSDNGKVEATGSYNELCSSGLVFTEQLAAIKATTEAISRQSSVTSQKSSISGADSLSALESKPPKQKAEMRAMGKVKGAVYRHYFLAGGSCGLALLVFSLCILAQLVTSTSDFWMSYWANTEDKRKLSEEANMTVSDYSNITSSEDLLETNTCIYIYTGLILSLIILTIGSIMMFFLMCMSASINLHNKLFNSIIHARVSFFTNYPSGQILNRFSKDMGSIDEILPLTLSDVLQRALILMGIIIVIAIANYWLLLVTSVMLVIFYLLRVYYVHTSRSLKRMEGITRSPAFSHLSASLQGLTTIRAFGAEAMMEKQFDEHQDVHSSVWYPSLVTNRAFGLCLDSICIVYIGIIALSFLLLGGQGGDVGLAITQAIALIGMLQWGIRQSAEMENQMTSVERVLEYTTVEQEPPFDSAPGAAPPKEWPRDGTIIFNHVFLVYVEGEPAVLRDVNFSIRQKEKIGIVGRTGAGKTSLITALFRLTELQSGSILIDGIDISKIGLHDLRSKISIIPQEPALFSGPLRENLDPFEQHSDAELWNVLEEVELKLAIEDLPGGLSHRVCEGGSNFSMGQRQLLCLARAILRNNKILVLDEATANVDPNTDELIQKTIRHKFSDCTVLTIAHRLQTVMDSDRILVMDDGSVVEFDAPHVLLSNTHGFLFKMVEETGTSMAETLQKMAQSTYKRV